MKSPLEKQLLKLQATQNNLLTQYSFGKIKTWKDFLIKVGYNEPWISENHTSEILNRECTFALIKEYFTKKQDELKSNPSPVLQTESPPPPVEEGSNEVIKLPSCKKEKAHLHWFQKKAALEILQAFEVI